jgi:Helix-turn-helix domain
MKEMKDWKINGTPREVVENTSLSLGARLLYVILRGYLGKNCDKPWPSYKELGNKLGCVPKTAFRYRKELTKAGLLTHEKRKLKNGGHGSNRYSFPMDIQIPPYGHRGPYPMDTSVQLRNNHYKEEPSKEKPIAWQDSETSEASRLRMREYLLRPVYRD